MELEFYTEKLLTKRLTKNKKVSFLFGSALSQIKDGSGIPNVSQVTKIIECFAKEHDLLDEYKEHLGSADSTDIYQKSFSFFSGFMGAGATQEIVKRVVMSNYCAVSNSHKIPGAIKSFVKAIKDNKIDVKNIFTTNFDTLIEEEFKNAEIAYNSISVVSDSDINDNSNGYINIIHLHGVWDKGDTMHTKNQLEAERVRIEASIRNCMTDGHLVVMAYSGWQDSFMRSLADIVNDTKAEYNFAWCFYESDKNKINAEEKSLFKSVQPAIQRDRIQFYKGIDCNYIFTDALHLQSSNKGSVLQLTAKELEVKEKQQRSQNSINYYDIQNKSFYLKIREKTRNKAIDLINKNKSVFIEAELGNGVYSFISSIISTVKDVKPNCVKIDLSSVISKKQIDDSVKANTNHNLQTLLLLLSQQSETVNFIIFDKIRGNADKDAISYLLDLPNSFEEICQNIVFIFTSKVQLKEFKKIHIKLRELIEPETGLILKEEFGKGRFSDVDVSRLHEKSEGVLSKLEKLVYYLDTSSTSEVLAQNDLFDESFQTEAIPDTTLKQLNILVNDPNKSLTFKMLKILSILKNGETLSNLRKDKMGLALGPKNTKELLELELATTIFIDESAVVVRVNPIIKDYVLSKMPLEEQFEIANAYLRVSVVEKNYGLKLGAVNKKILHYGYSLEEDNTTTILKLAIQQCSEALGQPDTSEKDKEKNQRKLNKLCYTARAYVYMLSHTSRYTEAISAYGNLIEYIKVVEPDKLYLYYCQMAYAHRMKSNYDEANRFLEMSIEQCPQNDKVTLDTQYREKLLLLESVDQKKAVAMAKANRGNHHKNSAEYILSDAIIANSKFGSDKINALARYEKKARKHGHITIANNLLLELSRDPNCNNKIQLFNTVIKSDESEYNHCRATISKHEVLVADNDFDKIKDSDIDKLKYIYNYTFRQKLDSLFNRCHKVLWAIAEYNRNSTLIIQIFFQSTIVWKLNSDEKNEEFYGKKYKELNSAIDSSNQT
ncbi:conserved hypothetical protein [Alteromonas sp. 38]|uniref:SIR2 family protein n=1 Tax=unclassified Alteromonas TaxID=2614992 RepID=UPI0012F188AA|nr:MULTISPECIES: SIR2 family protein [unclassified Alteromonas]CAD5255573.1 conserved hypothetical protein [Alteromonas sp. 154]VXA98137.1 conserved hypothetical protein [Alteromonas sp. 38]